MCIVSVKSFKDICNMAMFGFPLYVSIILCLTEEVYSDLKIISAIAELKDNIDKLAEKTGVIERQLNKSIDSINLKIHKLGHFSNAYTEEGDVVKTNERVIKALISEKGFVTKSLSEYEGRFKDFQKRMDEQMTVLNSTIEASHENLERKLAENVETLNSSLNKLQENNLTICDRPCENDGVCFKDGLCKCPQMITGDRCQTVLCHENCTRNGGECIKPGTCGNCPETRHGDNCQLEKTDCKYVVRIQVVDKQYADTDDNVKVRIYGHEKHTEAFRMKGIFGRNKLVEDEFRGIDVRPNILNIVYIHMEKPCTGHRKVEALVNI